MAKQTFLIFLLIATVTACTKAELASVPTPTAAPAAIAITTQEPSVTPTPLPTNTATATNTPTPTQTPAATPSPMPSPTLSLWNIDLGFRVINQIGGTITAMQISDNLAYLGIGPRLVVVDISNPSQPQVIGQSDILPGIVQNFVIVDELAFVASGENGFWIINIINPFAPQITAFEPLSIQVQQIKSQDNRLFVVGQKDDQPLENELVIYSLPDSQNVTEVSRVPFPYQWSVETILDDEFLYATGRFAERIHVLEFAQLDAPIFKDTISIADGAVKTIQDSTLYTLDNDGILEIFDVSNAQAPDEITRIENLIDSYWQNDAIAVYDKYLFVSVWYCDQSPCGATIIVFDISDYTQVREIARVPVGGHLVDIQVNNDRVYIATTNQLLILPLSEPDSWKPVGGIEDHRIYGVFDRLAIADDRLYMVNSFGYGVGIFDLEHPTQPVVVGRYIGAFDEVVAGNNQMYPAAHWQEGLHQVDVRNPALPRQTANLYDVSVDAMVLTGTRLFALLNGYLTILDVANHGGMNLLNEVDLSPEAYGPYRSISVLENFVYAQSQSGITLFDTSNPAAYSEIGFIPADETICALTVRNSYVFVFSTSYCGRDSESKYVTIYDAANPTMIQLVGRLEIDFFVEKMAVKGDNLYLFGDDLTVIDISQLNSPQITYHFPTPGYAQDAVLVNDLIYVADGAGGLLILQMTK